MECRLTELRLDYDAAVENWWQRFAFFARMWKLDVESVCFARSKRGGWHVIVRVQNRIVPTRVIAMQACLGSDPVREAINLVRVGALPVVSSFWRSRWNVLYETYWVTPTSRRRRKRK